MVSVERYTRAVLQKELTRLQGERRRLTGLKRLLEPEEQRELASIEARIDRLRSLLGRSAED